MADNFLERHRLEYEERKEAWLKNKKHMPKIKRRLVRPENESIIKKDKSAFVSLSSLLEIARSPYRLLACRLFK